MPTDPRLTTVVDDVLDFARDDWVGLWVILGWVKERMSGADSDQQKAATLAVCAAVLGRGLKAGDPPYAPGGFRAWSDQSVSSVIATISQQWAQLDHEPDIGEIVSFG